MNAKTKPHNHLNKATTLMTENTKQDTCSAGVPLPDFKEFDGIGVDDRNRMRFMFTQNPSNFSLPLPDRSDTIFVMFVP